MLQEALIFSVNTLADQCAMCRVKHIICLQGDWEKRNMRAGEAGLASAAFYDPPRRKKGKSAEPEEVLIRLLRLVKYEKRLVDQRSVVC